MIRVPKPLSRRRLVLCLLAMSCSLALYAQQPKEYPLIHLPQLRFSSADVPDSTVYGTWESVIPEAGGGAMHRSLGMQTVHTLLLPSGKILLASGSSWRNKAPLQYYPTFDNPAPGQGLFNREEDPFQEDNLDEYYQLVNNTALYDPEENTFFRIPSPEPMIDPEDPNQFIPNDMFCAGHLQLPDGNAMFVGGTQYYFPYRTGANTSYIFDWRAELDIDWQGIDWRFPWKGPNNPWVFSGLMKRGRWYPTLVPLLDGRFAIFSGFVGFDKGFPEMYQFEINHYVEFFDPYAFAAGGAQQAWKALDVKNTTNSPFDTRLPNPTHPDVCLDMEFFDELGIDPELGERVPCECPIRCQEAYQKDAFKLYPHNYLYEGNRIYLTREGDWVSLRTADTKWMRRTKFTYWMEVGGDAENPKVSFERGPDRPDIVTSYGTTFQIPDTDKIALLGGQPISAGTRLPLGATVPNHFVGGRGSAKLEIFDPKADRGQGAWTEDPDFLGDQFQDDRTMHYGITLPTKQVLVINGANYDFYGAVLFPIMLTPQYNRQGEMTGYSQQRMAEAVEPRLYHNTAILLPDGRVWVSGGNSARATVSLEKTPPKDPLYAGQPLPNPDLVELDVYFFTDGTMAKQQPGSNVTPTENWTAEIFSPPYLYIDGDRRAEIKGLTGSARDGATFESKIGEKTYYLLQSDQQYQVALEGLPSNPFTEEQSLVLIKLPSATHGGEWGQKFVELEITGSRGSSVSFRTPNMQEGNLPPGYYMLFYVDRMGKPSVAQMVRFDDKADAP